MNEFPSSFSELRLEVVIGIVSLVFGSTVADFEIHYVLGSFIDQAMPIPGTGLEAGAHARDEPSLTLVRMQYWITFEDIDNSSCLYEHDEATKLRWATGA